MGIKERKIVRYSQHNIFIQFNFQQYNLYNLYSWEHISLGLGRQKIIRRLDNLIHSFQWPDQRNMVMYNFQHIIQILDLYSSPNQNMLKRIREKFLIHIDLDIQDTYLRIYWQNYLRIDYYCNIHSYRFQYYHLPTTNQDKLGRTYQMYFVHMYHQDRFIHKLDYPTMQTNLMGINLCIRYLSNCCMRNLTQNK